MKNRTWFVKMLLVGPSALAAVTLASPAQAQNARYANGMAYWDVDPGPIDPGSYWTSGQYKYDPNGYMERNWRDPDQLHEMTVYADHAGKQNRVAANCQNHESAQPTNFGSGVKTSFAGIERLTPMSRWLPFR